MDPQIMAMLAQMFHPPQGQPPQPMGAMGGMGMSAPPPQPMGMGAPAPIQTAKDWGPPPKDWPPTREWPPKDHFIHPPGGDGGGNKPPPTPDYTTPAPPQNPFSMPGVKLFGPSPTITPMFRHLFGQQQVNDYGIRQPQQTISPTIGDKGQLNWNIGTNDKWWQQGSPTSWHTLPQPKAKGNNG